jgi:hypothetical protein
MEFYAILDQMVFGLWQEAVCLRWQARWLPCGSPQCATAGRGAAARLRDAAQQHMGQENSHEISSDGHTPVLFRKAGRAESAS